MSRNLMQQVISLRVMRGGKKIEERMVKMDIIPKMKMWKAISTHVKNANIDRYMSSNANIYYKISKKYI